MNDNTTPKAELWLKRLSAFFESGLSRKDWCQQNGISQSTLGYWIRKISSGVLETENKNPIFAKLPSEQEIRSAVNTESSPVTIFLPGNIRIEVSMDCPARLMSALVQALNSHA